MAGDDLRRRTEVDATASDGETALQSDGGLDAGLPSGLDCWDSSDCEADSTCRLAPSHILHFFRRIPGEKPCYSAVAGRCQKGQLASGCWCYIGPNRVIDLPTDGHGYLICTD